MILRSRPEVDNYINNSFSSGNIAQTANFRASAMLYQPESSLPAADQLTPETPYLGLKLNSTTCSSFPDYTISSENVREMITNWCSVDEGLVAVESYSFVNFTPA